MHRAFLLLVFVACLAAPANADLGARAPAKMIIPGPVVPPDPAVLRQGGDTMDDAFVIPSLPFAATGTCVGYNFNYDWSCGMEAGPYGDVVYAYTPPVDQRIDIDLCGTFDDTFLHVFYIDDGEFIRYACNDDYWFDDVCGEYVSRIPDLPAAAGVTYYIVVHGFYRTLEWYQISVTEFVPCDLGSLPGSDPEGEPPLVDNYHDTYNGGCNSLEYGAPFQHLSGDANGELSFAGVSGWYLYQGYPYRDTDWFTATIGAAGAVTVTADAEVEAYVLELGPQDCAAVAIVQTIAIGRCAPASLVITGTPGSTVWLWAGPISVPAPSYYHDDEFQYALWLTGLEAGVATETATWGAIKTLYR
jgi:hypothetical protein